MSTWCPSTTHAWGMKLMVPFLAGLATHVHRNKRVCSVDIAISFERSFL